MGRLKRLKKIRIHREGTHTLAGSLVLILAVNTALYFGLECKVPFYVVAVISLIVYGILVNVHANWYPVDGTVKKVWHQNGKFMKAWLPKASTDNERSTVVIETPEGVEIMARQIAGAMARRIVTYAEPGEECYIDEHMGFIKFGSRVDVFLPLGTEVFVKLGQLTTGNQTVIAKLK